jgi:copper ion binding protein
MKKIIAIEGMSCAHCQARVEKALNALPGVKAKVDLKKKNATVDLSAEVSDTTLMDAVNNVGYQAVSVSEKKGLFGG